MENNKSGALELDRNEQLEDERKRFKIMLDTLPISCCLVTRDLLCLECNTKAIELAGYESKSEYQENFSNLFPEYQPNHIRTTEYIREYIDKTFCSGSCEFELLLLAKNGDHIDMKINLEKVHYNGDDVMMVYAQDLRKEKRTIEENRYRENLSLSVHKAATRLLNAQLESFQIILRESLNLVAEAAKLDCIYLWKVGKDGDELTFERVINFSKNRFFIVSRDAEQTDHSYFGKVLSEWSNTLSKDICINQCMSDMPEEHHKFLLLSGMRSVFLVPVFIKGKYWGFVCFGDRKNRRVFTKLEESTLRPAARIFTDAVVTKELELNLQKAKDEAEKMSNAKTTFLAQISHEIRTPMNAVIGMSEIALRENDPDEKDRHITTVKHAASDLLVLINELLDFSKIELGTLETIRTEYSVSSLLNDVINITSVKVMATTLRFITYVDKDVPQYLYGDEAKTRQVLINVLSNAVKYTRRGHVSLEVYAENIDDDNVNIIYKITDSGRGIRREDMSTLFDPFARFDVEQNSDSEGVGLGLAITHNIIIAMGGTITVDSSWGVGSTFTITIPQTRFSNQTIATVPDDESVFVLLYERREIVSGSICKTFNNLSVNYTVVADDREFEQHLQSGIYTTVFISNNLYNLHKKHLSAVTLKAKVVVYLDYGEFSGGLKLEQGLNLISMPLYCVPIVNIFNGNPSKFPLPDNSSSDFGFTAPDAKILIVDDIDTNLAVAKGLMKPYNTQITLSTNGLEAIEHVKNTKFDIIFMDHKMPKMNGVEATMQIRKMGVNDIYYKNVPIIALTANAVAGIVEMFIECGFNDLLTKPINTFELNSILEKWIPANKQIRLSNTSDKDLDDSKTYHSDINTDACAKDAITGIDFDIGIKNASGSTELFRDLLETFCMDGQQRLVEMELCIETENTSLYSTHVHGIKSAAAIVGATELAAKAALLERAADKGDFETLKKDSPSFFAELEKILADVCAWLGKKLPHYASGSSSCPAI